MSCEDAVMRLVYGIAALCVLGCGAERPNAAPVNTARAHTESSSQGERITMPGTGVSLVPTPGATLTLIGSGVANESQGTSIIISIGPALRSLEQNPTWMQVYVHPAEALQLGDVLARIYTRTREQDGGAYDGYFLTATRGDRVLTALGFYQGSTPGAFAELRSSLQSLRWEPGLENTELAFGASAGGLDGLVMQQVVGGLSYENPDGDVKLSFLGGGRVDPEALGAVCARLPEEMFAGQGVVSNLVDSDYVQGCEAHGAGEQDTSRFFAFVITLDGWLVTIMASAPKPIFDAWVPRFEHAVRSLVPTR